MGGIVDVQHRLVGREGQTVRQREVVHDQLQAAIGRETVHAVRGLLLSRDRRRPPVRRPWHAGRARLNGIRRIGEVDGAVGLDHDVVGTVEALALEALGEDRAGAVIGDARHAAAIVLRRQHPSLAVERQPVGHADGVGGQLRPFGQPPPAHDALVGDVAEEQGARAPHGALGEGQSAGDALDGRVRRDEIVQASIARFQR